ncbi:ATP-binding protein [Streptomyces mirabilis]|uniref:ATP-binding protein n=1 Tax=Streptomyces mirabilis TaxID=68239 RepID=UPI003F5ECAA6
MVLPEHQGVGGDPGRSRLQRLRRLRCTPGQDRELTKHTDHCQQNKSVVRWGEVFGDDTVAAAMIDRLVHHADVLSLKGDSYRLKDRDIGRTPSAATG